jgi:hypothetical protein
MQSLLNGGPDNMSKQKNYMTKLERHQYERDTMTLNQLAQLTEQRTETLLRFLKVDPEARFICPQGCEHSAHAFVMSILHEHQDDALVARSGS